MILDSETWRAALSSELDRETLRSLLEAETAGESARLDLAVELVLCTADKAGLRTGTVKSVFGAVIKDRIENGLSVNTDDLDDTSERRVLRSCLVERVEKGIKLYREGLGQTELERYALETFELALHTLNMHRRIVQGAYEEETLGKVTPETCPPLETVLRIRTAEDPENGESGWYRAYCAFRCFYHMEARHASPHETLPHELREYALRMLEQGKQAYRKLEPAEQIEDWPLEGAEADFFRLLIVDPVELSRREERSAARLSLQLREAEKLKKERETLLHSSSYRVGRILTAPIRFLKKKRKAAGKKAVRLYYYRKVSNFGDILNESILDYLGFRCSYESFSSAEMVGLGSLLDCLLYDGRLGKYNLDQQKKAHTDKPIFIWGSGLLYSYGETAHPPIRPIKILALRGEWTRKQMSAFLNEPISCVLADPGLLAPCLVGKEEKAWDVGIVPHFRDADSETFVKLKEHYPNSCIIDVKDRPEAVLKKISACRYIISTSLHGIITADAYQIPNCWCENSDLVEGAGFKFHDYFSSFGTAREAFDLRTGLFPDLERDFRVSYSSYDQVTKKQQELIDCFPYPIPTVQNSKRLSGSLKRLRAAFR